MFQSIKILAIVFFLSLFSCQKNKHETNLECGESVIVNNVLYNTTSTDNYTITNVKIEGNCLFITIGSSGCNDDWKATLIDANQISESNPEQRNLKLSLENNQMCLAYFTKEFSFDIRKLQTNNHQIVLNLATWNQQITYSY